MRIRIFVQCLNASPQAQKALVNIRSLVNASKNTVSPFTSGQIDHTDRNIPSLNPENSMRPRAFGVQFGLVLSPVVDVLLDLLFHVVLVDHLLDITLGEVKKTI